MSDEVSTITYYLIALVVAGAIFSALIPFSDKYPIFRLETVILIIAIPLLVFGIATFRDLVGYSVAIISYYRRAGRVRRWFVDHDQEIAPYVAFQPTDDRPQFRIPFSLVAWRGGESIIMLFNAILFSVILNFFFQSIANTNPIIDAVLIIVLASLAWFFQSNYVVIKMNKVQVSYLQVGEVHFPYKEYFDETSSQQTK